MNRDMLRRRLEKKGYEVMEAGDGAEGIQKAQRRTRGPDSDGPSYAGVDGWEAARRLKSDDRTERIPIIAVTAQAIPGDREKSLECGCDDYDTKPIEFPRLLAKMNRLLSPEQADGA